MVEYVNELGKRSFIEIPPASNNDIFFRKFKEENEELFRQNMFKVVRAK